MSKLLIEILQDVNKDPKSITKYKEQYSALSVIFSYAYDKDKKFILPEGDPPYKHSVLPLGMNPTNLYSELRRFYVFCRTDLKPIKREQIFVSLLEGLHTSEANLMLAVKDQKLNKLFPKLTKKFAQDTGFLPKVANV